MKCPHCSIEFHDDWRPATLALQDADHVGITISYCTCPSCKRIIVRMSGLSNDIAPFERLIYPNGVTRPVPKEVPRPYSADFVEAVAVLPVSPKASAALSRRNLQAVLRDVAKVKHGNLSEEINEFIGRSSTPTTLGESIDAIRQLGNFAAHPMKSTHTGEILDVQPAEAEWLLDVLEALFDYCFVQPTRLEQKRLALDAKLAAASKPPMKRPKATNQ